MRRFKIAHISDLHIDYNDKNLIKEFELLLKKINSNNVNHLIITGDLIHNPIEKNYFILKNILKKYGFWSYNKLTVTIGNHEIFGGAEKTHTFPYQCKYTNYKENVHSFLVFFEKILSKNSSPKFPILKEISDNIILFIFNSVANWSANKNPIGSNGNVNTEQFRIANKILKNNIFINHIKIAVIHHHFYYTANHFYDELHRLWLYSERDTMVMHNYKKVLNFLKRNDIDLILHGHTHYTNIYKKNNITIINSSGCLKPLSNVKKRLFTLIELDNKTKRSEFKTKIIEA